MDDKLYRILIVLLAIFFPPVAVAVDKGCGSDLVINIILTIIIYIPGVIHALWVVLRNPPKSSGSANNA
ncbi:Plasma membrane proteolipid 3 [Smittium culicis]|uniref:Plasma membrane proteolipid 3 n=1 Tax=Smittium culicis TaxID=133412 RepID=A0A1R1YSV3_9FUNG|nr:Plasma membrane proteolipid 3 [Smittium culicis]